MLCGNELNVIGIDYTSLDLGSEVGVDGVYDVAVCSVGILSRGHYDEVSVTGIDYLYVVNCETVVEGNRDDSLHRTLVEELSDFDVCDLHNMFSFPMWRSRVSVSRSSFRPKLCYAYIIHREYYKYSLFCELFFEQIVEFLLTKAGKNRKNGTKMQKGGIKDAC